MSFDSAKTQVQLQYDSTVAGANLIYVGQNFFGIDVASTNWAIKKLTYDSTVIGANLTSVTNAFAAWTLRTSSGTVYR